MLYPFELRARVTANIIVYKHLKKNKPCTLHLVILVRYGVSAMTESTILELLKADRQRFRSNAFWVRFYRDGEDGTRIKVTEKLCDKTKEFFSVDCHAVTVLRDVRMAQVNADHHKELSTPTPLPQAPPLDIGTFWLTTYQPWVLANRRW